MTSRLQVSSTNGVLDLYVSGVNGSDSNDGLTTATPLLTLTRAEQLIPDVVNHSVRIHLGAHNVITGGYVLPTFRERTLRANIHVIGDGAGQAGAAGIFETELDAAQVAQAGTTPLAVVGTYGADRQGKTIVVDSGAAAGFRRTIRDTTETAGTLVPMFSILGFAPGDTFRVIEPSISLLISDVAATGAQQLMQRNGGGGTAGLNQVTIRGTGLFFWNVRKQAAIGATGSVSLNAVGGYLGYGGVEFAGAGTNPAPATTVPNFNVYEGTSFVAGFDSGTFATLLPDAAGLVGFQTPYVDGIVVGVAPSSALAWYGWGWSHWGSSLSFNTRGASTVQTFACLNATSLIGAGGKCNFSGRANALFGARDSSFIFVGGGSPDASRSLFLGQLSISFLSGLSLTNSIHRVTANAALTFTQSGFCTIAGSSQGVSITTVTSGVCVRIVGNSSVDLTTFATITFAPAVAGEVFALLSSGTTGVSNTFPATILTATGDFIAHADNGVIRRAS